VNGFWIGAAILSLAGAAFVLVPAWSLRRRAGASAGGPVVAGLIAIPAAIAIYSQVSTWQDVPNGAGDDALAMVRQLAERLETDPDDTEGWQLLGRSYIALGEYGRARAAFVEAWNRTPQPDTALKLGLAEALIWTDPSTARAQAGDLVEDVLAAEPTNQRALWWGGLVAAERGQAEAARSRWQLLLASNPPQQVADLLRQQLSLLPASASPTPATPPASGPAAGTGAGPQLTLAVSIAESLRSSPLSQTASLFIFARAPGGGPPLASIRAAVGSLPGTFSLSDADAIIAGRSLGAFDEIAIVARIAMTGNPVEQPGDLYGEATWRKGDETMLTIVIDSVVGAQ